jgi:hypothetical protein
MATVRTRSVRKEKGGGQEARLSRLSGLRAVTVLLTPEQHSWLRRRALDRVDAEGGRADASALIRELLEREMKRVGS